MRIRDFVPSEALSPLLAIFFLATTSFAQGSVGGMISGKVTANRDYAIGIASGEHIPSLYAVRVRASEPERHIVYTVFTHKGQYHFYNLPAGDYNISAIQDNFESTVAKVDLKPGDSKSVDVALTAKDEKPRYQLVDYDTLFPPSPTRDVLRKRAISNADAQHAAYHQGRFER